MRSITRACLAGHRDIVSPIHFSKPSMKIERIISSGIGYDFALAALARGDKVIATARPKSIHKLDGLQKKGANVLELDVSWPSEKLKDVVRDAESIYGRVDVLFNNAGPLNI